MPYSSIPPPLAAHVEPLLAGAGVDLAYYGHYHAVQRISAAFGGALVQKALDGVATNVAGDLTALHCFPNATVHFIVGSAGASFTNNSQVPPPEWLEQVFFRYGYSRLNVYNARCGAGVLMHNRGGEEWFYMRV